jgi:hypothetical protein
VNSLGRSLGMRLLLLIGVAVLAASCSSSPKLSQTFRANGVSLRYPTGWDAAEAPLTPVTDPVQVLAIGSYPLPHGFGGADGCMPKEALDRLPPSGAFVFGWEFDSAAEGFPPRPKHFALTHFEHYECLGPSYMLAFRDAGRFFRIHVVLGRHAGSRTRKTVLRILDSLSVRADTSGR